MRKAGDGKLAFLGDKLIQELEDGILLREEETSECFGLRQLILQGEQLVGPLI